MSTRTRTATALGTLFALALTLTSAIGPAHAAALPVADDAVSVQAGGRPRPPVPAPPMFRPDIRVKYVGPDYDNGTYFFRFKVENIGVATSDVFVDQDVQQLSYDGSVGKLQAIGSHKIDFLDADQSVEVRVHCTPLPGYVCAGASVDARADYDLDPSNNKAHSS